MKDSLGVASSVVRVLLSDLRITVVCKLFDSAGSQPENVFLDGFFGRGPFRGSSGQLTSPASCSAQAMPNLFGVLLYSFKFHTQKDRLSFTQPPPCLSPPGPADQVPYASVSQT